MLKRVALFLSLVMITSKGWSEDPYIPEPLEEWKQWVLDDSPELACPFMFNQKSSECVWVSSSRYSADDKALSFRMRVDIYAKQWLMLPGSQDLWPQNIQLLQGSKRVDAPVRSETSTSKPQIYLNPGRYTIQGKFSWAQMPSNIAIPDNIGILKLTLNGREVQTPEIDKAGRLWLRRNVRVAEKEVTNSEKIQVFRLIQDNNPAMVTTRVIMDISGQPRELILGQFLLNDFYPVYLNSALPARIEENRSLRVQVKPGRWFIDLKARRVGPLEQLMYQSSSPLWPQEEIWAFEANRTIRTVQIEGVTSIDPSQTNLPPEWKQFPSYRMTSGLEMQFKEVHRGDPTPEADDLSIRRNFYLDFDGKAFTVDDLLQGTVKKSWRLDSDINYQLGSAQLNGTPQLITQSLDKATQGLEIRDSNIRLKAVSRIGKDSEIQTTGWQQDFNRVDASLHLPPGWSLFATRGVDKVTHSWISRWNLWDIFLVLIIVVAVYRLFGIKAGALALVSILLLYHRENAPVIIWLNLIAVLALLKVTSGKLQRWLGMYQWGSIAILIMIILPFSIEQVRQAIYPQLQKYESDLSYFTDTANVETDYFEGEAVEEEMIVTSAARPQKLALPKAKQRITSAMPPQNYNQLQDPNAVVQTGPGVPNWQWHSVSFDWSGPVTQSENFSLYLVPPWLNRIGTMLAAIFSFVFAGFVVMRSREFLNPIPSSIAPVFLFMFLGLGMAQPSRADVIIDQELLDSLKARLLKDPACLPACGSVEEARLNIENSSLRFSITYNALDTIAIGLPAWRSEWLPSQVTRNGAPAVVKLGAGGQLFIKLEKGRHTIQMSGPVNRNQVEFRFGLPVHNFSFNAEGWDISGVSDGYVKTGSIQAQKIERSAVKEDVLLPDPMPQFVTVSRHLNLGLEWEVVTQVRRVAPANGAMTFLIPLIQGESPITKLDREGDKVRVVFGPQQNVFTWKSVMNQQNEIDFQAPEINSWYEQWRVVVAPIWHLDYKGIAPIKDEGSEVHSPLWLPWPGETLQLDITRPLATEGENITVDSVSMKHELGRRANATRLEFNIRTSRGGNFPFELPEGATLESLSINQQSQAIVNTSGKIEIPLRPGAQKVELSWKTDDGVSLVSKSPRVSLGENTVNARINIQTPHDRWSLFVGGPSMGPAVLLWGILIVVVFVAFFLGKQTLTPLRFHHWALLGVGISSTNVVTPLIVAGWLFALGARGKLSRELSPAKFNLLQVGLFFLSFIAIAMLLATIPLGLLSAPDMHITGNGSYANTLYWYQDRVSGPMPEAWVVSLPMYVYRIVMLLWSLWLAFALLGWLKWGWEQLNHRGIWCETKREPANKKSEEIEKSGD